ncbi:polymer-forming cytoskeletal protein [Thioclava sp. BHET1]|uniref:Integral membrane protein CcmA n=1 Tax=Thioclava dalianensis TaxID=1185766 RepID=A0A074TC27_9RHOB|nr:polymer-forming cytoskeletal protein [Thioclava dalianensis]KEP69326.1 integral membrane protein CcmA [Thioclava dalianensis]TMV91640.1 polymer-forming cytoskeletal protein [Thioclava sp. BHET1]SFN56882.1 protein CcmA, bactofilin family [Thioclava dalianensis]
MFSKSKIHEPGPKAGGETDKPATDGTLPSGRSGNDLPPSSSTPRVKPAPSVLSSDLTITGNIKTSGDIQIEGVVEGDIRAHLLTVGESATIKGEIIADDVVVNGRVVGRVRGLKVRLTSSARVEGDIIHKTIAIESGAHFEGSVQRQDDPLQTGQGTPKLAPPTPKEADAPK